MVLIWPVVYDIHIYCGNKKTGNRLNQRNFVSHPGNSQRQVIKAVGT